METKVYSCLGRMAETIIENKDFLTDLDREIGDADHGINMARGFQAVLEKVPSDNADIGLVLRKTGMALLSTVGGASGPLYGTAFMDAGKAVAGKVSLKPKDYRVILEAAVAGIQRRGKAVRGEKTMLDALMPALDAYTQKLEETESFADAMDAACSEARAGVEFTKTIRATKGRASYLGDRSIGHQDPGATSATLLLEAVRDFLKES